jgi:hypothetical protein
VWRLRDVDLSHRLPIRALPVLLLCLSSTALSADLESFLATDPAAEASRAFQAGDKRHIVVPVCQAQASEVMPGWPMSGPTHPGLWTALENGRRPFQCSDLGEGTRSAGFMRLLKYAEQYNKRLLELEGQ